MLKPKLQQARRKLRFSQAKVADLLGVSRSTYANYEAGRRVPDVYTALQLARILKRSVDELFPLERIG